MGELFSQIFTLTEKMTSNSMDISAACACFETETIVFHPQKRFIYVLYSMHKEFMFLSQ